jgi:uncharacterized membrane protein YebE (DUF533 family)
MTTIRNFLDQMLSQGRDLGARAEDAAASRLGVGEDAGSRRQMRNTAMGAGAAAGVLGLLLGSRGGRGVLRTGAVVGGLGLLGKVAYDAWSRTGGKGNQTAQDAPQITDLSEDDAARRAETLAWAMIAAAKADGTIDAAETARIEAALQELPMAVRAGLTTAMMRPADPAAIARRATSDQERREIYAASALMTGRDHPDEAAYLARLAGALGLPADQVAAIEAELTPA